MSASPALHEPSRLVCYHVVPVPGRDACPGRKRAESVTIRSVQGGVVRLNRPRVAEAVLVLVTIMLTAAGVAQAAVSPIWPELGGSASGDGVSGAIAPAVARDVAVAVGSDGRPVVAYTLYPGPVSSQGAITVKRWTGTTWETLSG